MSICGLKRVRNFQTKITEDLSQGAIGVVFPPLPEGLIRGTNESASDVHSAELDVPGRTDSVQDASECVSIYAKNDVGTRIQVPVDPLLRGALPALLT